MKNFFTQKINQKGDTTILLSVLVLSLVLTAVLSVSGVILLGLKMSRQIADSTPAFFAADAAAEQCLYQIRKTGGGCKNIGGSASVSLPNGASAAATRMDVATINSLGIFSSTSRKIEIKGTLEEFCSPYFADSNTIGLWHFEETFGTGAYLIDSSANNNNGTPTGTSALPGICNARSFNGSSEYIDFGNNPILRISNGTLEAWINTSSTAVQFAAGIPYSDSSSWNNPWVGMQIGTSGNQGRFWLNVNGIDREFVAGTINLNQWYHLVLTYNGATALGYINGVLVGSNSIAGSILYSGNPSFMVGIRSKQAQGEWFNGKIDEVWFSNAVKSAAQIKADYNNACAKLTPMPSPCPAL